MDASQSPRPHPRRYRNIANNNGFRTCCVGYIAIIYSVKASINFIYCGHLVTLAMFSLVQVVLRCGARCSRAATVL
jgi:hypothetical protein